MNESRDNRENKWEKRGFSFLLSLSLSPILGDQKNGRTKNDIIPSIVVNVERINKNGRVHLHRNRNGL